MSAVHLVVILISLISSLGFAQDPPPESDGIVPIRLVLPLSAAGKEVHIEVGEIPEGARGIRAIVEYQKEKIAAVRASNPNATIESTSVVDPTDRAAVEEAAAFDRTARESKVPNERISYREKLSNNLTAIKNDSLDAFTPYARRVVTFLRFTVNGSIVFAGLMLTTNTETMAASIIGVTAAAVLDGTIMGVLSASVTKYTEAFNLYLTKHNGRLFSQSAFLRKWIEKSSYLEKRFPKVNDPSEIPSSGIVALHAKWLNLEFVFTTVLKGMMAGTGYPIEAGMALVNNILFNSTLVLVSQGSWSMYANVQARDRIEAEPHLEGRHNTSLMIREFIYSVAWATILMSGQGAESHLKPFLETIHPLLSEHAKIAVPMFGHALFGIFGYYKYFGYIRQKARAEAIKAAQTPVRRILPADCHRAYGVTGS